MDPRQRPWHAALCATLLGLLLSEARIEYTLLAAAALLAAHAGLRAEALGGLLAALLLAAAGFGHLRLEALGSRAGDLAAAPRVQATAYLLERPRPSPFGARATVLLRSGPGAGARVQAKGHSHLHWPRGSRPGQALQVSGRFASTAEVARRPRGRSGFDLARHLRSRGLAGELRLDSIRAGGPARGGPAGAVDALRSRAEAAVQRGLPAPEAALMRGMVLGQDEEIDEDVRESFRASGLAHVLAVSGQNVALLCALALPALALLGVGQRARIAALLALIALYVPLAGAGPSLQRAGIMGAAALAALAASRPASRAYALLGAAVVTLGLNPRVVDDPGWQLSFAAVVGILSLAPSLRRRLGWLPRLAAEGVAVTLAATLATGPLLAHHFGSLSLASLPANVLALPAVPLIMWAGMSSMAVGQVAAVGPPLDGLAEGASTLLGTAARPLLGYLATLAERCAELPGAHLALPVGSAAGVAGAYLAIVLAGLAAWRVERRLQRPAVSAGAVWRGLPRGRRRALLGLLAGAAALLAAGELGPSRPPSRATVSFLDVGQGDATLVQAPDGSAALFDGGPPEGGVLRKLKRAGVRRLALVVATHPSRDHHGGLPGVLEGLPVDLLLDGGDGSTEPGFRAVLHAARRRRVRSIPARAGLAVRAGSISLRILSPSPRPPGPPPEDPNPRGVVALVEVGGMRVLLSADAESEALLPLELPRVDAMKVPHHGSADPGLPEVLARLRPRVASIPVGPNTYGHPTSSTLRALRAAGVRTLRNDLDGTVRVSSSERGLQVTSQR